MASPLSGFVNALADAAQHGQLKREAESAQELAQQRSVYATLLQHSDDPEIKALALTGLTEKPQKDFLGKLKKSPNFEHFHQIVQQTMNPPGPPSDIVAPPLGAGGEKAPSSPAQAPAPPGAAGMPDVAPLTGGGGAAAAPAPPGMALAAPAPASGSAAPGPSAASAGHPADQLHPQGVQTYDQMLALSRSRDPMGLDPMHQKFRSMVQTLQMAGIPVEQGRRMIYDEMMPQTAALERLSAGITARTDAQKTIEDVKQKHKLEQEEAKRLVSLTPDQAEALGIPDVDPDTDVVKLDKTALSLFGRKQVVATQQAGATARKGMGAAAAPKLQKITTMDDDGRKVTTFVIPQAGASYVAAPGATEETRNRQAERILAMRDDLLDTLANDKEVRQHLGPAMGRVTKLEQLWGDPDPKVQEFSAALSSWLAMQPALHGFRGQQALREFERVSGGVIRTPEALAASIRGLSKAAESFAKSKPTGGPPKASTNPNYKGPTTTFTKGPLAGKQGVWSDAAGGYVPAP